MLRLTNDGRPITVANDVQTNSAERLAHLDRTFIVAETRCGCYLQLVFTGSDRVHSKSMIAIVPGQMDQIDADVKSAQLQRIARSFADAAREHDTEIYKRAEDYANQPDHTHLDRIMDLTSVEDYVRGLLFLHLGSSIDIFEMAEFDYILKHPFLSGDAKARHILLSASVIAGGV